MVGVVVEGLGEPAELVPRPLLFFRRGQPVGDRSGGLGAEGDARPAGHPLGLVMLVSGEQLVAAVAGEGDGHVLAGHFGDEVSGEDRKIPERLVQMADELFRELQGFRLEDELLVLRLEQLGDPAGVGQLVIGLVFESDGERPQGRGPELPHQPDDGRGVDPAAEEGPEGHVAHQPELDRFLEKRIKLVLDGAEATGPGGLRASARSPSIF